jgi:hypothetical protein
LESRRSKKNEGEKEKQKKEKKEMFTQQHILSVHQLVFQQHPDSLRVVSGTDGNPTVLSIKLGSENRF